MHRDILAYYLTHIDQLPQEKQFHLYSRLFLWCQYPGTKEQLDHLYLSWATKNGDVEAKLAVLAISPPDTSEVSKQLVNAGDLRKPYFEKYQNIYNYNAVLSRILFLSTVYGQDYRHMFYKLFGKTEVATFRKMLLADNKGLARLSTYAINFLYNVERVVDHEPALNPERFLEIGRNEYDTSDKNQLQLLIYLYTHCILGASAFYYRAINPAKSPVYQQMIDELELLIDTHFTDIHLDNKFEFLVCAAILGYTSPLKARIFAEADTSLSDKGAFLIDRHNANPQTNKIDIGTSEHRNVLFIMASLPFSPRQSA